MSDLMNYVSVQEPAVLEALMNAVSDAYEEYRSTMQQFKSLLTLCWSRSRRWRPPTSRTVQSLGYSGEMA